MRKMSVLLPSVMLSFVATLFLVAGVAGLVVPEIVPSLARPAVAWALVGVGVTLDLGAVWQLMSARSASAARGAEK